MEPEGASARDRALGVRGAVEAVKRGDAVGIFPEGNIGPTSAMIRAQQGSRSLLTRFELAGRGAYSNGNIRAGSADACCFRAGN